MGLCSLLLCLGLAVGMLELCFVTCSKLCAVMGPRTAS